MAADFDKLLFLTLVSSRVSSADVLCSLGPIDEDIEMAGESPTVVITAREVATNKGPKIIVTTGKVVVGVPSQGYVVSPIIHDVHHSKEPLGVITLRYLYSVKQVSCSIILGCMNAFLLLLGA